MGIATRQTTANKQRYLSIVDSYANAGCDQLVRDLLGFLAPAGRINVVQPFNTVAGAEAFVERIVRPMYVAFDHLHRRCDMLFGGEYQGREWVVSHGHYVGEFRKPWIGIAPSDDIVRIHYVEYHAIEDGVATETYLYFDTVDLLRQIGIWTLPPSVGYEGFVPGPASGDGICLTTAEPAASDKSLAMVDEMLSRLYTPDESWRPYWHDDMVWYGPSGYGSYLGVDGFARFQLPYEAIFEKGRVRNTYRLSGDTTLDNAVPGHYARFADGNYVASGGWPSHGGFMVSDWLGVEARQQMFTVRVADIWRRAGDQLIENWVFVDVIDMLMQLGRNLFDEAGIELDLS